jgi:hypothetical protein
VVGWDELLSNPGSLEGRLPAGALLRIDSPGESPPAERLLLALGAGERDERFEAPRLPRAQALALEDDPGRISFPRQRFLGFRAALRLLARLLRGRPDLRVMNAPADIVTMCDKPSCHERLARLGVPRPRLLGTPRSFDELAALMRASGTTQVFVKLANGSSASGVVAYRTSGTRHVAITTLERDGATLYNSKRVRRYDEVRPLFDLLCREGVIVERWVPKVSLAGRSLDLRVLAIAGRARHLVVRTSPTPITNLHVGGENRRLPVERLRASLGDERLRAALAVAVRAAAAFPASLYAGVDVLVTAGAALVAEVNAFGDLLRHTTDEGQDPWEAELAA